MNAPSKISTLFFLALTVIAISKDAKAQELKKVRVGIGGGAFIPTAANYGSGLVLFVEPSYWVNSNFSANFRYEGAYSQYLSVLSYSFNAQYYLSRSARKIRPFIGFGAGLFSATYKHLSILNANTVNASSQSAFGFYPRIGTDYNRFSLSVDWNLCMGSKVTFVDYALGGPVNYTADVNSSYLSVRGSVVLGGGKISH